MAHVGDKGESCLYCAKALCMVFPDRQDKQAGFSCIATGRRGSLNLNLWDSRLGPTLGNKGDISRQVASRPLPYYFFYLAGEGDLEEDEDVVVTLEEDPPPAPPDSMAAATAAAVRGCGCGGSGCGEEEDAAAIDEGHPPPPPPPGE